MIFYKQLNKHRPDEGVIGDCWRTCIACYLEIEPARVPHFVELHIQGAESTDVLTNKYMEGDYKLLPIAYHGTDDIDTFLLGHANCTAEKDIVFILVGTSRNGTDHCVLMRNGKILWDPAIDNSGIVGPASDGYYWLYALVSDISVIRDESGSLSDKEEV